MSTKKWKNKELSEILSKKFGFKMNLGALNESKEITHMCALHVTHKKSGKEGHPIAHTLTESGDISHYTVEFRLFTYLLTSSSLLRSRFRRIKLRQSF